MPVLTVAERVTVFLLGVAGIFLTPSIETEPEKIIWVMLCVFVTVSSCIPNKEKDNGPAR